MPEARDRRVTPLDVATLFTPHRPSSIFQDSLTIAPAPFTTGSDLFVAQRTPTFRGGARQPHAPGVQNTPPATARRAIHRGSRSILPSWYPRTPLRDITAIVLAIERRGTLRREEELQQTATTTPFSADRLIIFSDPSSISASSSSRAIQKTPQSSAIKVKTPKGSKVPKIQIDIAKLPQEGEDSEFLTPEKKLLNNINEVQIAVQQELLKLKRTPLAKKVEREKRMRTLMSMR